MTLKLEPLHDVFVAQASGIDLSRPLSHADACAINAAMNQYAVLVWRDQPLSVQQQVHFARTFGTLDVGLNRLYNRKPRFGDHTVIDISNVDEHGGLHQREAQKNVSNFANQLWHSDSSFLNPRAAYSMLHAVVLPSWGGNTEFADLRDAYDRLDAKTRAEVEPLQAEHYALHTRIMLGDDTYTEAQKAAIAPVIWPLVDTHPGSGRKLLFVGVHARRIVGWPVAESRVFLSDLLEHATQRERVYAHQWRVGDTVMWDNRSTVHRGRRYDLAERRELRRTTTNYAADAMLATA